MAPNKEKYTEKNNYSIVTKITFGEVNMLLTGDAEELSEKEILDAGFDVKADIFKVRTPRK